MTFLRSLHLMSTPPVGNVKAVGIDDCAWKRGKRYGTVIIDLQTHRLIDLLPDREAESVKQWLVAHPEIEIVSRDRAGAYAEGPSQGAPQAQQIADWWYVCKNLGDVVEDYLKRQQIQIPSALSADTVLPEVPVPPAMPPPVAPVKHTCASHGKTARKQTAIDHVKSSHQEGKYPTINASVQWTLPSFW